MTTFIKKPHIQTIEYARKHAIEWQSWASGQNLSYGELYEWQCYFSELCGQFPELEDEFIENGII
jgi:hypothetical protein